MDSVKWYYLDAGQQQGPTNTKNLKALLSTGELSPGTMVWAATLTDWQPANTIGILNRNRTSHTPHWVKAFILVFGSALGFGFGGKYLIDKISQTDPTPPMIMGKTITDSYENEASLLLPDEQARASQEKKEPLRINHRTRESKPGRLAINPAAPLPNPDAAERKDTQENMFVNLQAENKALAKQIRELKATQGDPLAKTKLIRTTQQLNELKKNYLESEREKQALQTRLQQELKRPELEPTKQSEEELRKIQVELAQKDQRARILEEQLKILRASFTKLQSIKLMKQTPPSAPVAHIANVDVKRRILVLNLASINELSVGETLRVISKTSGENLGNAKVSRVLGSKCVAKFEGKNISRLTLGDHVLRQLGQ